MDQVSHSGLKEKTFLPFTEAASQYQSLMTPLVCKYIQWWLWPVSCYFLLKSFRSFLQEAMKVSAPLLIGRLLSYFQPEPAVSRTDAYIAATLLSLVAFTEGIIHAPTFFLSQRCGLHLQIAMGSLVYRKVSTSRSAAYYCGLKKLQIHSHVYTRVVQAD